MSEQYLSFTLQNSYYGINVRHIQEVLTYTPPVKGPCAVPYIEGLIDSRAEGITVINLRSKFHLKHVEPDKNTRIIILEIATPVPDQEDHISVFGAVADSVQEVIELSDEEIEPPPKFGNAISSEYISGLGKKDDKFIILLDPEKVFSSVTALGAGQPAATALS